MRQLVLAACGIGAWLALAGPARAQDDESRAAVARAMKAMGGEDKLAAYKGSHVKAKGTVSIMGMDLTFTAELFGQEPDKQKAVIEFSVMGMNFTLVEVFNGDKGWRSINGKTDKLTADDLKEHKEDENAERVSRLVALKEKQYKLSSLGDVKVGEHQTVGVLVSREGYRDVSLYFDKKTHLLVKSETRGLNPEKQEVAVEKLFSDYKELIPGVRVASKIVVNHDGKRFLDINVTEARAVDHDASIFAEP
jgi:hypothetical protein